MNRRVVQTILVMLAAWTSVAAHAAISCTISSPGWATAYVPSTAATNITQSSITVTCQRNIAADVTNVNISLVPNNGLHATGQQNRVQLNAANRINYENYTNSSCGTLWSAVNTIASSITGLAGFTPKSTTLSFWGCVAGSQTGLAAGTYTDTVTMTLTYGPTNTTTTATFPVTLVSPASCTVTTAPGTIAFTYTAFRATAAAGTTTFRVTCTNLLPYTMALDATTAVIAGLQYSLALSSTSATGTGAAQLYTITGTMPADQAGTCTTASCGATQARTLTISY
jgi:spore coat protein U-like protein